MKYALILFVSLLMGSSFAQTTNFIEVSAFETVKLKIESIQVHLILESEDEQLETMMYRDFDYSEMEYTEEYYDYEEDWMYEEMMRDSPKKVTKEMKKAYEERAERRASIERQDMEREEEYSRKVSEFEPKTLTDLKLKLNDLGFTYQVLKSNRYYPGDYEEYEDYYDDEAEDTDSLLEIMVTNKADWSRLKEGLLDFPLDYEAIDANYETIEGRFSELIKSVTAKAKLEAEALATAMDRKLGKVIECTNVHPYTPSKRYMTTLDRNFNRARIDLLSDDPFSNFKEEIIEYIYKFQLL